jgi:apolipoprotein N-acyltransferase
MDVKNWRKHEHELNARVALVRAAEYNMPIFRIASSGISQLVNAGGVETATAPFGEDGAIISGQMEIFSGGRIPGNMNPGRMPIDRYLAPLAVAVTAIFILWLPVAGLWRRLLQTRKPGQPLEL